MKKKTTFRRLFSDLMKQKIKLIFVFSGTVISAVLGIIYPIIIAKAIEEIIGEKHEISGISLFYVLILVLLLIFIIRGIFSYIQEYIMSSVSQTLILDMRKQISEKLNRLPLKYFDSHKKGDILSRTTSDTEKIADTIQNSLSQIISSSVAMIGAVFMMFMLSPILAAAVLLTVIISMIVTVMIAGKTQKYQTDNQNALGNYNAGIEEIFNGNTIIKAFGLQNTMTEYAENLNEELYRTGKKAQFITYIINPVIQLLNHIGYVAVAFGGAWLVIKGSISVAYIPAFFQYTNKSSESIMNTAYLINNLQTAIAAASRVYELLDEEEQKPDIAEYSLECVKGNIKFEHISFGYDKCNMLMNDINLDIKSGSKIAVVGPTGAGKTTLVNLIMRFYELNKGRITIDGTDISLIPRSELYSAVGMVLQDTWLFKGTIAENIAYGKKNAAQEEIEKAAKSAQIDFFIRTLPNGYQTILDDETANISAGQKQLLTIARAILAKPSILILDEATSSIDTRTELMIQKAMDYLLQGRTSFIIAHRLSTIRDADCILVMQNGNIIEYGTHDELINKNGFYYELYNAQFTTVSGG